MNQDFDRVPDRRSSESGKWNRYPEDVLPLWVADMDFACPRPLLDAMRHRLDHPILGYSQDLDPLKELICERLEKSQSWKVEPSSLVFVPGLVSALNVSCRALQSRGETVLVQTPVYPPFLSAPTLQDQKLQAIPLLREERNEYWHFQPDFDRLRKEAEQASLLLLCNPQNPTGRSYSEEELRSVGEIALEHELILCSDEIHGDLLLDDTQHLSIAALDSKIEQQTITLISPSKTFNMPGMSIGIAVIPNSGLRQRFQQASRGIVPHVNVLSMHAAIAAYRDCGDWLRRLRSYLTENRDFLLTYLHTYLPEIRSTRPEATFLAWLDCSRLELPRGPYRFFLDQARVALNDGATFGGDYDRFARLNFGCPQSVLKDALDRLRSAM